MPSVLLPNLGNMSQVAHEQGQQIRLHVFRHVWQQVCQPVLQLLASPMDTIGQRQRLTAPVQTRRSVNRHGIFVGLKPADQGIDRLMGPAKDALHLSPNLPGMVQRSLLVVMKTSTATLGVAF